MSLRYEHVKHRATWTSWSGARACGEASRGQARVDSCSDGGLRRGQGDEEHVAEEAHGTATRPVDCRQSVPERETARETATQPFDCKRREPGTGEWRGTRTRRSGAGSGGGRGTRTRREGGVRKIGRDRSAATTTWAWRCSRRRTHNSGTGGADEQDWRPCGETAFHKIGPRASHW